ncbi:MAG TPA: hypothetical protein VNF51_02310 [Candidatus Paceibacterota bacterium]|nr:hypothetical protein [Candidatus Paceibacterota bacterium]
MRKFILAVAMVGLFPLARAGECRVKLIDRGDGWVDVVQTPICKQGDTMLGESSDQASASLGKRVLCAAGEGKYGELKKSGTVYRFKCTYAGMKRHRSANNAI